MEFSSPNSKNILMELESLKSKESIFKMKEINYIKDKEILEDSIKTLQKDLQDKSEIIRTLKKNLDSQSVNLYRDLTLKNDELEKSLLENNDMAKKLTIAMETIDHYTKRNEKLRSEFEKQKRNYERESECKSRLVVFFETSCSQKETKILNLSSEINCLKSGLTDIESQFDKQKEISEELRANIININNRFAIEQQEKDQELQRAKNEILQLQQNGISELHLEKMNPVAAITIKTLKSSKSLMDIYSELHNIISERDYLQLEKSRLLKNKEELEDHLFCKESEITKLTTESDENHKVTESLKSRLLSLVSDLRISETKRGKIEREVLLARRKLEISEKEVVRLMEQVRVLLLTGENGESIKQEPVDVDSAMYTSVQELQEVNRVLRNDNDVLRTRLEESDSEQFKQRCNELQLYSDTLKAEVEHLSHQNTSSNNLLLVHEKQVKMLRFLIELKSPGSKISITKALKSLEEGIKSNVEIVSECDESDHDQSRDSLPEIVQDTDRVAKLENDISEILYNKRASDQVFLTSIESMRSDFINKNRLSIDLLGKLEELTNQFNEEREINEKYRKESELLRAINKNLSQTAAALEAQIDEFKLKLECKISQLAETKAELDTCKTKLESLRSQLGRSRSERDEFKITMNKQEELLMNINSLQNMANLKDHLYLSNTQHKLEVLEKTVEELNMELKQKDDTINFIQMQLDESKALEEKYIERLNPVETCDVDCQILITVCDTHCENETMSDLQSIIIPNQDLIVLEYKNTIDYLEHEIREMKAKCISNNDKIDTYVHDMTELQKKCDFYEAQLNIQEKAKQEVLNENIKITEEAHNLNSLLKQDLIKYQDKLSQMKVRLEEAENVERTAQNVIDKYVKECNEAKAKYKRELTLHATDSKLLDVVNKEIEQLKSRENSEDERCKQLQQELEFCEEKMEYQLSEMRIQMNDIEQQLKDAENKNDRLYEQLLKISEDNSNVVMNEIIDDLRGQIKVDKLSCSLSNVEKDKYEGEIERLQSELIDLQEQLGLEKNKSSSNISDVFSDSSVETEIIKESNQILREQKLNLDKLVLSQKNEIDDCVKLISRLKTNFSNLEVQYNNVLTVKGELEEERNRWKDRCTKLIERAEQMDPEKYRIACNDRDRFEKQAMEEENNFKVAQCELNNAREEIKGLLNSIVDEQNKKRKEEADSLKLKKIARKYKDEAEKKSQIILDLEQIVEELNKDKSQLLVEKEETQIKVEEKVTELESNKNNFDEVKESLILNFDKLKAEFDCCKTTFAKEKEELLLKLKSVESELESTLKMLEEVSCRCELLEQIGNEKSFKSQLSENIIVRLKEEIATLKNSQIEVTNMKRVNDEKLENEPESKKQKFTNEELNDISKEDISAVYDTNINDLDDKCVEQTVADLKEIDENNAVDSSKVWWNVNSTDDEELINQIQMNLEQYKPEDDEFEEDLETQDQCYEKSSNEELSEVSLHICGSINDERDIDGDNEVADEINLGSGDNTFYDVENANDEFDDTVKEIINNEEVEEIMDKYDDIEGIKKDDTVDATEKNNGNDYYPKDGNNPGEDDTRSNIEQNEDGCQYNEEEYQFDEECNKMEEDDDQEIAHSLHIEDSDSSGNESAMEDKVNFNMIYEQQNDSEDSDSENESNSSSVVVIEDDTDDESQLAAEVDGDEITTIDLNTSEEKDGSDEIVNIQVTSDNNKLENSEPKIQTIDENRPPLSNTINEIGSNVSKRGPIRKLKRRAGY